MPRRYSPPEGQIIQAFTFALDPTDEQAAMIARFFGARRKAFNWTLDQMKSDLDRYHASRGRPLRSTHFASAGTPIRTPSVSTTPLATSGGPRSRRKSSPTACAAPPTPTGAGRSHEPV